MFAALSAAVPRVFSCAAIFEKASMQSIARLRSGALSGIGAVPVFVEAFVSRAGDPQTVIVGLPDASVRESQHRVSSAIINAGYDPFGGRVTVNLAPADVHKEGSLFDLPIALAIILASGDEETPPASAAGASRRFDPETTAVVGELSLGGTVRPVRGVLPVAVALRDAGARTLIVPAENAREAAFVSGIDVFPVSTLGEALALFTGKGSGPVEPVVCDVRAALAAAADSGPDFVDVKGQEMAKRAIEVAVAGGHNVLLVGPPGTGKSMLARRIPSILPPLSLEEALEVTKIHSVAGLLPPGQPLVATRPFRSPHHTVSDVALVGGGTHPSPGEVTLAHHGVLFLDELPEFGRSALEVMRQPLEDGFVTISRASGTARFPSRFTLVAAMNPCPCGHFGDPYRPCRCTRTQIQRYRSRISGPLLDRIDLHILVAASSLRDLQGIPAGENSADMRSRVAFARRIQSERFAGRPEPRTNAAMDRRDLERHCHLDAECLQILNDAINDLKFSPRSHDRILKVARTVADLAGHADIEPVDLHEALGFRSLDRDLWS